MDALTGSRLKSIRKILVIQLGPFGDALLTTSYFEALRSTLPGARLHYLVKEPYDKIIRDHPAIDEIIVIPRRTGIGYAIERLKTVRRIRSRGFDLVIDQQNMPSSQQLTLLSGAPYRLGYRDARFSWSYNLKAGRGPLRYSASRKFDILGPLGIEERPYRLCFRIPGDAQDRMDSWLENTPFGHGEAVCVSPGSPVSHKRWSPEGFARLVDLIQARTGCRVILLWGPGERGDVNAVASQMETGPLVAPPTDLYEAAALLRRSRLLICNDGGLNHIAVTTATPTLAIFGPTDPVAWSPASVFSTHHHLHCRDCDWAKDDSFGITPEMAFEKVLEILSKQPGEAMPAETEPGGGPDGGNETGGGS
ncbi:MAG: glycosyltransferase family 9 protein [bacterium]